MKRHLACALLLAALFTMLPSRAGALILRGAGGDTGNHSDHSQVGFGETFTVDDTHPAKDIVCFFCTVRVHGDVSGDLVTFFGTVDVSEGHAIQGDAVLFGGSLSLANEARVGKDLVVFGSDLSQAASATVGGDHVIFAGSGWLLAPLLPLLIPIGLIWLLARVVFRRRYQFPAYPMGRRF